MPTKQQLLQREAKRVKKGQLKFEESLRWAKTDIETRKKRAKRAIREANEAPEEPKRWRKDQELSIEGRIAQQKT